MIYYLCFCYVDIYFSHAAYAHCFYYYYYYYCYDILDSSSPTWFNMIDGQVNMRDAIRETITFSNPNGKQYSLRKDGKIAVLLVR